MRFAESRFEDLWWCLTVLGPLNSNFLGSETPEGKGLRRVAWQ
jgi:hypothetical protein